jgi:hypothetical protein
MIWGTIKLMLILEFFRWWYGDGWQEVAKRSLGIVKKVELSFSLSVLFRTLFSPWKMITTNPGRSFDDRMHAALDNMISRIVGFFVRIFSLVTALILMAGAAIIGIVMTAGWPFIPVLIILAAVRGVI